MNTLLPVLAAALTIPAPANRLQEDIVRSLPARGGAVGLELFVSPEGEVLDCSAPSQPAQALASRVCQRAIGKKLATPARGPGGEAIHGLSRFAVSTSGPAPDYTPADLVIDIQRLPGGKPRQTAWLNVLIDAEGRLTHCQATNSAEEFFARIGCEQAGAQRWTIRKSKAGDPVPYSAALKIDLVEMRPIDR